MGVILTIGGPGGVRMITGQETVTITPYFGHTRLVSRLNGRLEMYQRNAAHHFAMGNYHEAKEASIRVATMRVAIEDAEAMEGRNE